MPPRPIEFSADQKREVETLAALLSQDQIADYFGIGRTTFYEIMKRDPEVAEHYKKGKAKAIAHVANGLLQKARGGCTTSSIFYLKTQPGWRETDRLEHSGPGGGPIEVANVTERLREFLDRRAERLRQIAGSDVVEGTLADAGS